MQFWFHLPGTAISVHPVSSIVVHIFDFLAYFLASMSLVGLVDCRIQLYMMQVLKPADFDSSWLEA